MVEVPGSMHFEAPEELTLRQRARDSLITALLWGIYLYLWVPLISLVAWALGFEFAYDVMVRAGGAKGLVTILLQYTVVVSLIFAMFTIWSVTNRLRFKDLNRRHRREPVALEAIAEYFKVSESDALTLRSRKILHVDIDETGRPEIVATGFEHEDEPDVDLWIDDGPDTGARGHKRVI